MVRHEVGPENLSLVLLCRIHSVADSLGNLNAES